MVLALGAVGLSARAQVRLSCGPAGRGQAAADGEHCACVAPQFVEALVGGVRRCVPRPAVSPVMVGRRHGVEASCVEGDHVSDGHCCGPGEEWLPARRRCVCLEPSVCASGAAAVASASSAQGSPESLPETPSRDDVRRAMQSGAADVRACRAGQGSSAWVTTVFDNTGRVISVRMQGVASARAIACIERVVRRITLPHFRQATFSVTYPFPL